MRNNNNYWEVLLPTTYLGGVGVSADHIDTSCYFVNQKLPGSHIWYYHVNFIGWYYISISVLKKSWFRFQSSIYVADNFICCMTDSFLILSFHVLLLSSILACINSCNKTVGQFSVWKWMLSNQYFLLNRKCAIIAVHNRQLQKRILFVRRRWFWRGCCCWFSQLVFLCLSYILTLFSQFRCLLLAATQECVSNNGKVTTHRLPTAKIESHQKKNCQAGLT